MEPAKDLIKDLNDYLVTIKKIAYIVRRKVPENSLQIDDLVQAGVIGFLEAYKKYDSTKGASFSTYANIRIYGSMMDEIRRVDWAPRSSYKSIRMIAQAKKDICDKTGREAKFSEIKDHMGLSSQEFGNLLRMIDSYKVTIVEDISAMEDFFDKGSDNDEIVNNLQKEYFLQELIKGVDTLPEMERNIINWYYNEDTNQRVIGERLGVSESRICQIRQKALKELRVKMKKWI